mmetsp:Transcript_24798/g.62363  ORF Transcript_24798/g.62363 Transcript_24798/m.62363 type:complete len:341 (+) Transcript_24798:866-1888(+)
MKGPVRWRVRVVNHARDGLQHGVQAGLVEKGHGVALAGLVGEHAVQRRLEAVVGGDLEKVADVDDKRVGHGLYCHPGGIVLCHPVSVSGVHLEAADVILSQHRDKDLVSVRRDAQVRGRVVAERVVVEAHEAAVALEVRVEVVRGHAEAHGEELGEKVCQACHLFVVLHHRRAETECRGVGARAIQPLIHPVHIIRNAVWPHIEPLLPVPLLLGEFVVKPAPRILRAAPNLRLHVLRLLEEPPLCLRSLLPQPFVDPVSHHVENPQRRRRGGNLPRGAPVCRRVFVRGSQHGAQVDHRDRCAGGGGGAHRSTAAVLPPASRTERAPAGPHNKSSVRGCPA